MESHTGKVRRDGSAVMESHTGKVRRDGSAVMESHTGKVRRDGSAVMESHTGKAYRLLAAKQSTLHQLQTNHWIISFSEIRVAEQTWKL